MTMGILTTPSLCTLSVQLQGTVEVHNTMMKIRDGNAKDLKIRLFFLGFFASQCRKCKVMLFKTARFQIKFRETKANQSKGEFNEESIRTYVNTCKYLQARENSSDRVLIGRDGDASVYKARPMRLQISDTQLKTALSETQAENENSTRTQP